MRLALLTAIYNFNICIVRFKKIVIFNDSLAKIINLSSTIKCFNKFLVIAVGITDCCLFFNIFIVRFKKIVIYSDSANYSVATNSLFSVAALYKTSHPEYASYLYLMAPISLAILNPISFVFMEIGRLRASDEYLLDDDLAISQTIHRRFKLVVSVAKSIFLNPIVFMTILGILGNFIFKHKIPCYLGGVLDVLGSAFSASALFLLGLRMVGKVHKLRGATLVVPGILIMVKL